MAGFRALCQAEVAETLAKAGPAQVRQAGPPKAPPRPAQRGWPAQGAGGVPPEEIWTAPPCSADDRRPLVDTAQLVSRTVNSFHNSGRLFVYVATENSRDL